MRYGMIQRQRDVSGLENSSIAELIYKKVCYMEDPFYSDELEAISNKVKVR